MVDDKIVNQVVQKFEKRSIIGFLKYGTNLERDDLKFLEWINHLQDELMDASLYLEKLKDELKRLPDPNKRQSH
jgi:hypothetical protein